jgi:2-keto-4-pentenoate hydratase/2-oxohepta-3-ene-1,7-dioic acid hydratase in catechol pathway
MMRLLRYGPFGEEKPGLLDKEGHIRDLFHYLNDFNPETLQDPSLLAQLHALNIEHLPIVDMSVRIGACVGAPGKVICVGLNSAKHAQQVGLALLPPDEMVLFLKATSAICGPYDPILYTRMMRKLDWEAELAIVIGKKGKYIPKEEAHSYIFGYTCMNDLSERYWQLQTADKQFMKGKSFDHAAPLGPYLVTRDALNSSSSLDVKLWVNGKLRQSFNTSEYIHDDASIVSYASQFFTLYPGDVISMGTGAGNAASFGNEFLKPGDQVRFAIEGIGEQYQEVILE